MLMLVGVVLVEVNSFTVELFKVQLDVFKAQPGLLYKVQFVNVLASKVLSESNIYSIVQFLNVFASVYCILNQLQLINVLFL